nr:uncharacterized protein LOC115268837 [Aedes albopictus]
MASENYSLDDSGNLNRTANSQRTLVTPPGSDFVDSLEGAVGGLNPARTPRIVWADQMLMGVSANGPEVHGLSLDSRLPVPNNLQAEMDHAARLQLSAEGFPLPFRGVPSSTRLERAAGNDSDDLPAMMGFSDPGAETTQGTNPFLTPGYRGPEGTISNTGLRGRQTQSLNGSFLLPRDDAVPLLNSTVQPIVSSGNTMTNGRPTVPRPAFDSQPSSSTQGHRMLGAVQTNVPACQDGGFRTSISETGVSTQYVWGQTEGIAQTGRQPPVNESDTSHNYVHVSEIQNYVQTYVRQLLTGQPNRPVVPDMVVNHLAQEIGSIGLHNPGVPDVSRTPDGVHVVSQEPPRLPAPLQMRNADRSGLQPESRGSPINHETPPAFREVLRNSWPSFVNPGYPRSPVGPTVRDQLPEPRFRTNYPLNASPNVQPTNEEGTQYQMRRGASAKSPTFEKSNRLPHVVDNILFRM